jgi:hypothetical protein
MGLGRGTGIGGCRIILDLDFRICWIGMKVLGETHEMTTVVYCIVPSTSNRSIPLNQNIILPKTKTFILSQVHFALTEWRHGYGCGIDIDRVQ